MKLKMNGFLAWIYMSTYSVAYYELPKDLCSFFWKSLFSMILLPFAWVSHIFNILAHRSRPDNGMPAFLGIVISILMLTIGFAMTLGSNYRDSSIFFKYLVGLISFTVIVAVILGLEFLAHTIARFVGRFRTDEYKPKKEKQSGMIATYWKAFKEKHCPRIEWIQ